MVPLKRFITFTEIKRYGVHRRVHGLHKDGVGGKRAIGHISMHADNASCMRDVKTGVLWNIENIRRTPCAKVSPKNISSQGVWMDW